MIGKKLVFQLIWTFYHVKKSKVNRNKIYLIFISPKKIVAFTIILALTLFIELLSHFRIRKFTNKTELGIV